MASSRGILETGDRQAIDSCINATEISLCRCYGRGEIVWQPAHQRFVVFSYIPKSMEGAVEGPEGPGAQFGYLDSLNIDIAKDEAIKYYNNLPFRE